MGIIQQFRRTIEGSRTMDTIRGAGDWLSSARQAVQAWGGSLRTAAENGSTFIGLTANGTDNICSEIENYVLGIEEAAADLVTSADPQQFIHGATSGEIRGYLEACQELLTDYVSYYRAYKSKMVEHADNLRANDEALQSAMQEETQELKNKTERYQDTSGK